MEVKPLKSNELHYRCRQSCWLNELTGCIARFKGEVNRSQNMVSVDIPCKCAWMRQVNGFSEIDMEAYQEVKDKLSKSNGILHNCYDMTVFMKQFPEAIFNNSNGDEYGFWIDTEKYTYAIWCKLTSEGYSFCGYCYIKEQLDFYIKNAEKGIRFVSRRPEENFYLLDGG